MKDWTHELSDKIFARYLQTGAFPGCVDSILANGYGRVECLPEHVLDAGPDLGLSSGPTTAYQPSAAATQATTAVEMEMSGMARRMDDSTAGQMSMSVMSTSGSPGPTTSMTGRMRMASSADGSQSMMARGPRSCTPPMMFRPGYNISSLPPETCTNPTSPQLTIPANALQGRLALNLVNSGVVSALRVSLDSYLMYVYAADGLYVTLQEVKISRHSRFLESLANLCRFWKSPLASDIQ